MSCGDDAGADYSTISEVLALAGLVRRSRVLGELEQGIEQRLRDLAGSLQQQVTEARCRDLELRRVLQTDPAIGNLLREHGIDPQNL